MTKKQKIWFWVFFAMFVVPEVLWGAVSGVLYLFFKINIRPVFPDSQIINSHYSLVVLILVAELVGIIGVWKILIKNNNLNKITRYFLYFIFLLIVMALIIVGYLSYALDKTFQ